MSKDLLRTDSHNDNTPKDKTTEDPSTDASVLYPCQANMDVGPNEAIQIKTVMEESIHNDWTGHALSGDPLSRHCLEMLTFSLAVLEWDRDAFFENELPAFLLGQRRSIIVKAVNHILFSRNLIAMDKQDPQLDEKRFLELHTQLMKGINDDAGLYRNDIRGHHLNMVEVEMERFFVVKKPKKCSRIWYASITSLNEFDFSAMAMI